MDSWQDPQQIALWIGLFILLSIVLVVVFIRALRHYIRRILEVEQAAALEKQNHQKRLLDLSVEIQETERARVAADLHDDVVSKLNAMRIINQTSYDTDKMDSLLGEGMALVRRISHDLSPPLLEMQSIMEIIEELAEPWQNLLEIDLFFSTHDVEKMPTEMKLHVLRIIQELFVNIGKHAAASCVKVLVRHTPSYLAVKIQDDGKGFKPEDLKLGLGMKNLEIRVEHLNGKYKLRSNEGTTVLFKLPSME